jgi:hypothetical protein
MVRRAKLRSVDGQKLPKEEKHQQIQTDMLFRDDILCKLSNENSAISYPSSKTLRHGDCATPAPVAPPKTNVPASLVNNFPAYSCDAGTVPDAVTLEIFALRRRNAELIAKVESLNNKLSRALECLQSLRRFFRLWLYEGQGESYDAIVGRMSKIDVMIDLIEDRMVGPAPVIEIPERWRKS